MRKFLIIILIVVVAAGGLVAYFVATTPTTSAGVRFPLSAAQRALIASVPAEADAFALIPTAAALEAKLQRNPITRGALEEWSSKQTLPAPWMIGRADLLAWRVGKQTRYLVRLDPVRAALVRLYLMVRGDSGALLINAPEGAGLPSDEVARIAALAATLPAGDALVVQRESQRGFPPIGRPAVTSLRIEATDLVLTSHAPAAAVAAAPGVLTASFPSSAMLTIAFASPPKAANDLNRLFGTRVSTLFEAGGALTLYDVDARKLLPRPVGVIALPSDETRREALDRFLHAVSPAEAVGVHARTGERDGQLLLSFDDSLDTYLKDATERGSWPGARWVVRLDPRRVVPIVNQLREDLGLRLAAPHLYQSVRDLDRSIGNLQEATRIDAVDLVKGEIEELQVRVAGR